jgi:alkylation response protein AidB-like acyl-CoA dehydrogenase
MNADTQLERKLLRDAAARFIQAACPLSRVRELIDSDSGLPGGYLRAAGELGWFAMLDPDEGGETAGAPWAGAGLGNLAAIAAERGQVLQPGPFVPNNVTVAALASRGSTPAQAETQAELAAGETTASWALGDGSDVAGRGARIEATRSGDSFVLSGRAGPSQDGAIASWWLVTAHSPVGLSQFLVPADRPGIVVTPVTAHDLTQRFATLSLDQVRVDAAEMVGQPGGATIDDVARQIVLATVMVVADTVGAMSALFEMALQYAKDRIAFGRPIGSFQALKHQLADMSLSLEASRAVLDAAIAAQDTGAPDAAETASIAKAWVGDHGIDLAQGCLQVFGGIGYTWEHNLHLFLRRITMNALLYGAPEWHRERICVVQGLRGPS